MKIDEQARYADAICRRMCDNKPFLRQQLVGVRSAKASDIPNTTGIGNIAYLAMHADAEYRAEYHTRYTQLISDLRTLYGVTERVTSAP